MSDVNRYVNTGSVGGDGTTNNKTGANAAYASRASWNTSEATNLVTDGDIHILQCDGDGGTDDTTKLTMSAWTTGASNYITVTNTNSYKQGCTSNYSICFTMNEDYYREDGYIGENSATFANSSNNDSIINVGSGGGSSSDIRFTNVHILGSPREGILHGGGVGTYSNILIEDCGGNYGFFVTYNVSAPNGTILRHATVVNSGTIEAIGCNNANYLTVKNCYAHDNGSTNGGYGANVQTNYVTCAASDTTGSSTALDNVAFSTINFENVTGGSEDLHIKSGSNLNGGGTNISGDNNYVSTDLDGISWENPPSIGCYEFVSVGGVVYERTLSDSASASDQQQSYEDKLRLLVDNINISDSIIRTVQIFTIIIERILSSNITVSDSTGSDKEMNRLLSSNIEINDLLIRTLQTASSTIERTLSSNIVIGDLIGADKLLSRLIFDGVDVNDAIQKIIATIYEVVLRSNIDVNDGIETQKQIERLLINTIVIADNILQDKNLCRLLSDNVILADAIITSILAASVTYSRVLSDSVSLQDSIIREITSLLRGYILIAVKDSGIDIDTKQSNIVMDTVKANIETDTRN